MKDIIQRESYQKWSINWGKGAHSCSSSWGSQSDVSKRNNKVNTSCTAVFDRELKRRQLTTFFRFLFPSPSRSFHFHSKMVCKQIESQTTWNSRRMVAETWCYIFRWRSLYRQQNKSKSGERLQVCQSRWIQTIKQANHSVDEFIQPVQGIGTGVRRIKSPNGNYACLCGQQSQTITITRNIFCQSLNFETLNQGICETTFNYLLEIIPIATWSGLTTDFTVRLLETALRKLCTP